jgi:hypothetical protein
MITEKARHEVYEAVKRKIEQISSAEPCGTVNMKGYYIHSDDHGNFKNSYFQIYNLYFDSDGIIRADVNYFKNSFEHNVIFGRSLDEFRTDELKKILKYLQRIRKSDNTACVQKNNINSKHDLLLSLIKAVQTLAFSESFHRKPNES